MQPFADYLNDFFKGRSLYSPIVRALNVLLSACIASALFKWRYFDYTLLDITDYKGIYKFFINGHFAVPLLLFVIVHYGTGFFSYSLFHGLSFLLCRRWRRILDALGVGEQRPYFVQIVGLMKKGVSAKEHERLRRLANKAQEMSTINFRLTMKGMIALCVFVAIIPYLGWKLYTLAMIGSAVGLVGFVFTYAVIDLFPEVVKKLEQPVAKPQQLTPPWMKPDQPSG